MDNTNFKHFEFSKLIGIDKYKTIRSEKAHALFMTQINNEKSKKVLIFNRELEGNIGNFETIIKLDKEWLV
ncbi:hypothetical protein ABE099_12995 [Paenibacillus turicensis]|uniref:hypothetical protein n=1 Tax=Paenibacillus turicensis TaxID=160487 RepID=UPI003D26E861